MSISRTGGSSKYDDAEVQSIHALIRWPGSAQSSADDGADANDLDQIEPLGGSLSRGEVGELLAWIPRGLDVTFEGVDSSGGGRMNLRMEWSTDSEAHLYGPDTDVGTNTFSADPDDDGTDELTGEIHTSEAVDILYHEFRNAYQPFTDNTNGPGGTGHMGIGLGHPMYFTEHWSRGPLLDHTDDIHLHGGIHYDNVNSADGINIECFVQYQLLWRVHEVDDPFDNI